MIEAGEQAQYAAIDIYNRYKVVVISGLNTIETLNLSEVGKLKLEEDLSHLLEGQRIVRFETGNNPEDTLGIALLTDERGDRKYYENTSGGDCQADDQFYNFAIESRDGKKLKLGYFI